MQNKIFDFKNTLLLPSTNFPMRASLPTREPEWLQSLGKIKYLPKIEEKSSGGRLLFYMMDHLMLMGIFILVMHLIKY